jgi:ribokinase
MRVFTLGDIKRDTFVALPDASLFCKKQDPSCSLCFSYGEKIPVGAFFSQIAGTAPNVAIGLKKLNFAAGVISSIGTDQDAQDALTFLAHAGIDTSYISQIHTSHMTHAVVLNFKGESTQLVAENNTLHVFPHKLPAADLLHISEIGKGYKKIFRDILAYHKKTKTPLSINPGAIQIRDRSRELLALIQASSILFVNRKEATLLTKLPSSASPKKLLSALLALGPHTVIMTDGMQGAYAANTQQRFFAPLFPGERKEATGAGDAFSAGVLGALLAKKPLSEALAWGSVNATSVIAYIGPTAGLLHAKEITKRLRQEEGYRVQSL